MEWQRLLRLREGRDDYSDVFRSVALQSKQRHAMIATHINEAAARHREMQTLLAFLEKEKADAEGTLQGMD
jgi:hypothetical protein